jgi:hypothetical protein
MWCTSGKANAFTRKAHGRSHPLFVNNNPSRKVEMKEPFAMHQSRRPWRALGNNGAVQKDYPCASQTTTKHTPKFNLRRAFGAHKGRSTTEICFLPSLLSNVFALYEIGPGAAELEWTAAHSSSAHGLSPNNKLRPSSKNFVSI